MHLWNTVCNLSLWLLWSTTYMQLITSYDLKIGMANCKLPTILVMHTWLSYNSPVLVFERDLGTMLRNVVSTEQANDFPPWVSVAAISRSHLPPNILYPVVHHSRYSLVAISECFGRQRVNQLAKQPEIHVINMEYASSYAVWHELWMLCSACKICDGSTPATRCRICIWWAIWPCCIEFIILAV